MFRFRLRILRFIGIESKVLESLVCFFIIATGFIPVLLLSVVLGKQPVAWKEYCVEHWLKNKNSQVPMIKLK